jgi:hypothetical protein
VGDAVAPSARRRRRRRGGWRRWRRGCAASV